MSDLPPDLVEEILSRVPATSLKRLRSTCKEWNALLNNRRFTEKHFREAPKQSHALLRKDFRVCPMRINLNVAAPSIEFKSVLSLKNSHNNSEHIDIAKVVHCDGLLLCTTKDGRLVLWNPCLGETRWIQLEADYEKHTRFALGYQNNKSCRCYKILRFSKSYLTPNHMDVVSKIYELTSDSWRVLLDKVALNYFLLESENSVSLKGNTYCSRQRQLPEQGYSWRTEYEAEKADMSYEKEMFDRFLKQVEAENQEILRLGSELKVERNDLS
ncbi:F-box domain [Arabidopsis suecica]|uniref:F-box domain n=1 Tax=Arabidopsis suecica TaxID=45249 RepID=A0A8T2BBN5_ARASU|nr:F-box domain [Arabidopsis suecica]